MTNKLPYQIYKKLLKHFGPQGWWPIGGIYNPKKKRFTDNEKFEIMTGAILTQNTAWNNVEKALSNLRKEKKLNIEHISKINLKKLQTLIKPSGFYKQKATRLKNFAKTILAFKTLNNIERSELLSLNGVGPETADSILLYALEKPYFVVDAYTKRIINRLAIFKSEDYDEIQNFFQNNLPKNVGIYKEYHALIVELAKKHCKNKPDCKKCPIIANCADSQPRCKPRRSLQERRRGVGT